jgi:hypothetical protein
MTEPRYKFVRHQKKPEYMLVYDSVTNGFVVELFESHAIVVMLMYDNLYKQNPKAADEFLYGHNLGMTYTMLFADKYPKVEKITGPNGTVVKMTETTGKVREIHPELSDTTREMLRRTDKL